MNVAPKAIAAAALLALARAALATPSTTYWTVATTYTQPFLVPHVTYDTYFGEPGAFPVDTGLTMGVLPFEKVQAEVGFDLLYPAKGAGALLLNAKLTLVEGTLGQWSPGLSVGIMNLGFKKDVNDFDMIHATLGKGFGPAGTFGLGAYYGTNPRLFVDSTGAVKRTGLLASWMGPDITVGLSGLDKIVLAGDVQTGKNAFGAIGGGIYFYFTPAIDLLVGPVFFFEKDLQPGQASWLWTMQLDVDVDLHRKKGGS